MGEEDEEEEEEGEEEENREARMLDAKPFSITGGSDRCERVFQPFCKRAHSDQSCRAEVVPGPRATARVCGCPLVPAAVPRPIWRARAEYKYPPHTHI